jgi:hypothetical protein
MPITPPGAHRAGVPVALDEVCLTALERDPERRFSTAAAFATAIEEASRGAMMDVRDVGKIVADRLAASIERHRAALRRVPADAAVEPETHQETMTATMPTLVAPLAPSQRLAPVARASRGRSILAASVVGGTMLVVAIVIALGRKPTALPETNEDGAAALIATEPASSPAPTAAPSLATPSTASTAASPAARSSKAHAPGSHRPAPHAPGVVSTGTPPPPSPRSTGAFVPTEP